MHSIIRTCDHCTIYTLKPVCPRCGAPSHQSMPPRYSPEDHYGKYRRRLKREYYEQQQA